MKQTFIKITTLIVFASLIAVFVIYRSSENKPPDQAGAVERRSSENKEQQAPVRDTAHLPVKSGSAQKSEKPVHAAKRKIKRVQEQEVPEAEILPQVDMETEAFRLDTTKSVTFLGGSKSVMVMPRFHLNDVLKTSKKKK